MQIVEDNTDGMEIIACLKE